MELRREQMSLPGKKQLHAQPENPRTREQWREAVNTAHFLLLLDSARQYGLVTGGPEIDVERCEEILTLGKARGIEPKEYHRE